MGRSRINISILSEDLYFRFRQVAKNNKNRAEERSSVFFVFDTLLCRLHIDYIFATMPQNTFASVIIKQIEMIAFTEIERAEIRSIVKSAISEALNENGVTIAPRQPKYLRGLKELADYLHCGLSTANRLKKSGKIPYSQNGKIVLFDVAKVDEAISKIKFKR